MSDVEKLIEEASDALSDGRTVYLYVGDQLAYIVHPPPVPLRYDEGGKRRLMKRAREVLGDADVG